MKYRIPFLFLILFGFSLIAAGCSSDDDYNLCFTPPAAVVFEFTDSDGNNLIENGELKISDIKIKEMIGNDQTQNVGFILREDNRITVGGIGWYNVTKDYTFESPLIEFGFQVKSSSISGSCGGYRIDNIEFLGASPILGDYDIYKFVIE